MTVEAQVVTVVSDYNGLMALITQVVVLVVLLIDKDTLVVLVVMAVVVMAHVMVRLQQLVQQTQAVEVAVADTRVIKESLVAQVLLYLDTFHRRYMAHFAKIDSNNIVTDVIVAEQDFINSGLVGDSFLWIQTSYNGNFRKNFASIGYSYDTTRDAFIAPKNYPSWVLDEVTCRYEAPVPYPTDGLMYSWDEDTTSWVETTGEI
jgi:hypothetical protein